MKNRFPRLFLGALLTAGFLPGLRPSSATEAPVGGIVLVISDGTSQELITAARIYANGVTSHLALESLPHTAIVRTYSGSDVVTDSAAGATAIARGIKADNLVVGMANAGSKSSPPSLLDLARQAGWSTGIVTDDSVTGATEAPFLLEHKNRNDEAAIAAKTIAALGPRADIVLGGGRKWFSDLTGSPGVSYKPGELDPVRANAKALSASAIAEFDQWQPFVDYVATLPAGGNERPLLGLFAPAEFSFYADGKRSLRVADLASEALRFLRARHKPFFLMVEAALPDKACHLGNAKRAIIEVLELDNLVQRLRSELGPGTLLLVTTDHNNGGLAISGPPVPLATRGDALLGPNPITRAPSILTWATGPGANLAAANIRNRIVSEPNQPDRVIQEVRQPPDPDYVQPAAILNGAVEHTGGDVWMLGVGPGSENVHGYLDNTDIYRLIAAQIKAASAR